jgi:hypothetical protein
MSETAETSMTGTTWNLTGSRLARLVASPGGDRSGVQGSEVEE